jgi:DNA-3-methyladenine glycosylase I
MNRYHDTEWGVPVHDDRKHYEFLVLEAAQAGLSWRTVLHKRENYRVAFAGFDPAVVARFGDAELQAMLQNAGLVRNRAKLNAAIRNAGLFCELAATEGSFSRWLWGFVDGKPVANRWTDTSQIPPRTDLSDRVSAELKKRGFSFVGSTVIYAHLQAAGLVNDHLVQCARHREVGG